MVCECLLWLSGSWLLTCFSLDFFLHLLLHVSLFSLQMTALKCAKVPEWQEKNLAAGGKNRHYIGAKKNYS